MTNQKPVNRYLICETIKKYEYYYVWADTPNDALLKHKEHYGDSEYYDAEYGNTIKGE